MGVVTRTARRHAALIGVVALLGARAAGAVGVTVTASRAESLYSATGDPKCSELSQMTDAALPLNVVRLRATVDGVAPDQVRYRWSLPHPEVGSLAADLDLGPAEETAAIRGLCAEFGNACVLTPDKLPFYNQPTILWIAPTCEDLPMKTTRNFAGGTVRIGVTILQGKRRLGKGVAPPLGYGRAASVTLFMDGRDGVGVPGGLPSDINPFFGAVVAAPGIMLPPGGEFAFESGGGSAATVSSCTDQPPQGDLHNYNACTGRLLYQQAGKFLANVKETFDDGSALCDNVTVKVLSATIIPRLTVRADPSGTYVPGDAKRGSARLTVTLTNASPRQGGSGILLIGGNVLTCNSDVKVAGTTDSRQTTFDLQHCSITTSQGCQSDAECQPGFCDGCTPDETCLTESHCSQSFDQPCIGDNDCKPPTCPGCGDDEKCIQVLATPAIIVDIGQSVNLIDKVVALENVFPSPARIKDSWTVNTFNAGSEDDVMSYRIKPQPRAPATR